MEIFNAELLDFWRAMEANDVKFLMIGGFAVNMHGYARATNDVDVWILDTFENRGNLGRVLDKYGYSGTQWQTVQFIPGWSEIFIGPGLILDVLTAMKGMGEVDFKDAFKRASVAKIYDVKVPFLDIDLLILNKKASNRSKDQIDVSELQKIKDARQDLGSGR